MGQKIVGDWWGLFRSPEIDAVVRQAIADSPTLARSKAVLAQARNTVAATAGVLYPQVNLNAGITREKPSAAPLGFKSSAFPLPQNFNLYSVGPTVSYSLDLFGGNRRSVEQSEAQAEYASYLLDAAYLSLTGNTVAAAIEFASVQAQLRAVDDIVTVDRQNLDLVQKERAAGMVADPDVVSAAAQLATDETLTPPLRQQLSVARHALAVLVGKAPGDWSPPSFELAHITLPSELPVSLPAELVRQRPDILAAEAQLHSASAAIGVATAQLYPNITLSASGGQEALSPSALFNPASLVWSIAAGLTQPIFDGGIREADRRVALDGFKIAAADYQQTVLVSFGQVADVLQALSHDTELLAAERRALDTASASLDLQRKSYAGGSTGILNVLDAERQFQQARLGYVRADAQRYQDTVQLLVAMGGGWWKDRTAVNP
jgi:NodT family efflux transporter outer membrane factor (OMF) lipoprotein